MPKKTVSLDELLAATRGQTGAISLAQAAGIPRGTGDPWPESEVVEMLQWTLLTPHEAAWVFSGLWRKGGAALTAQDRTALTWYECEFRNAAALGQFPHVKTMDAPPDPSMSAGAILAAPKAFHDCLVAHGHPVDPFVADYFASAL